MASNSANPLNRRILEPKGTGRVREATGNSATSSSSASKAGTGVRRREQTFEEQQRQHRAATVLESNEMLVWASMEMCEVLLSSVLLPPTTHLPPHYHLLPIFNPMLSHKVKC